MTQEVFHHILNDLLNKRGPLDMGDHSLFGTVSESENHINMIESARYLTNDLLFRSTNDPQFDNTKNAAIVIVDSEPEQLPSGATPGRPITVTMRDYWLRRLHHILQTDFVEYNARPYQDYTMYAIQNSIILQTIRRSRPQRRWF